MLGRVVNQGHEAKVDGKRVDGVDLVDFSGRSRPAESCRRSTSSTGSTKSTPVH